MWIRSQDKEMLVKAVNFYTSPSTIDKAYYIFVHDVNKIELCVGVYEDYYRCIEIVDEIEYYIKLNWKVYQMPPAKLIL